MLNEFPNVTSNLSPRLKKKAQQTWNQLDIF